MSATTRASPTTMIREATAADAAALLAFVQDLPPDDLLFLRRDIREISEIERWLASCEAERCWTAVAIDAMERVAGYVLLDRGDVPWRVHVGELHALVSPEFRRQGLGYRLLGAGFRQAMMERVSKIVVWLTREQEAAQAVVMRLGLTHEATLARHVRDTAGRTHDLLIFSLDLAHPGSGRCANCRDSAPLGLTLEGLPLCWGCYGLRAIEFGIGD